MEGEELVIVEVLVGEVEFEGIGVDGGVGEGDVVGDGLLVEVGLVEFLLELVDGLLEFGVGGGELFGLEEEGGVESVLFVLGGF